MCRETFLLFCIGVVCCVVLCCVVLVVCSLRSVEHYRIVNMLSCMICFIVHMLFLNKSINEKNKK